MNGNTENSNKTLTSNSDISDVSKRYIQLNRDDLQKHKNNLHIDKIVLYDFKGSAMSREEMHKAEHIIFIDGEQIKELKNRYAKW